VCGCEARVLIDTPVHNSSFVGRAREQEHARRCMRRAPSHHAKITNVRLFVVSVGGLQQMRRCGLEVSNAEIV
jgi:hypothetical protein